MKTLVILISLSFGFVFISCDPNNSDPNPVVHDWFPESPKNIVDLNTVYDDYNSNIERIGKGFDLYYSSTKKSEGQGYDIACGHFDVYVNRENGIVEFEVFPDNAFWSETILPVINSANNELGPFSFDWIKDRYDTHGNWLFLYANDRNGNFDINFTNINISEWVQGSSHQKIYGPVQAKVFNSSSNDYYPTINSDFTQFYFCSDRNGDFDIFKVDISKSDLTDWLETGNDIATVCNISSDYDDKCPYIDGNLLVFASNRKNGFGGFDLWYSLYENEKWSEPVNFGPNVNTEYDEYRPAIEYFQDSKNDLMIFSSNRPGGKGEFDLYYTGIEKMIKK
jgi:hypothetical protein